MSGTDGEQCADLQVTADDGSQGAAPQPAADDGSQGATPQLAADDALRSTSSQVEADDGFFFGVGAFETIAVAAGRPLLLDAHLARLCRACEYLGVDADAGELAREVRKRAAAPEVAGGRWALKLTVTPDNRLITLRPNPYGPARYDQGFSLVTSPVRRNEGSPLTAMKTLCYADCILAKREAWAAGFDEPVMLNNRGELAEGATTNLFLVLDGRMLTPPVECGLLPGVARAWVLEQGAAREAVLYPEDLARCEEAFVTNSLMGVMPVRSIDGRRLPLREHARALLARWQAEVDPSMGCRG